MRCLAFSLATLTLLCGAPVFAQEPRLDTIPVASIDFYGLHTVRDSTVRRAFRMPTGVPLPDSTFIARGAGGAAPVRPARGSL